MPAPTIVAVQTVSAATPASFTGAFPTGYTTAVAGDVQVLAVSNAAGIAHGAPAAGWTTLRSAATPSSQQKLSIYYRVLAGGDSTGTVMTPSPVSGSTDYTRIIIRGTDTSSPFGGITPTVADGNSTSLVAPTITTVTDNSLLLALFVQSRTSGATTATLSLPAGMTAGTSTVGYQANSYISRLDSQAISPAGATGTRTSTASGAGSWSATLFVAVPVGNTDYVKNPADTAAGSDTLTSQLAAMRNAADGAAGADAATASFAFTGSGSDAAAAVDAVTIAYTKAISDTAAVIDAIVRDHGETYADTAGAVDAVIAGRAALGVDAAGAVDNVAALITKQILASDFAAIVDTVISAPILSPVFHDTSFAADAFISALDVARAGTDAAAAVDTIVVTWGENIADTAAGIDAVTFVITATRSVADVAAGVDAVVRALAMLKTLADVAAATDASARGRGVFSADTAAISDVGIGEKIVPLSASTSIFVTLAGAFAPARPFDVTPYVVADGIAETSMREVRMMTGTASVDVDMNTSILNEGAEFFNVDIDMVSPLTSIKRLSADAFVNIDLDASDLEAVPEVIVVEVDGVDSDLTQVRTLSGVASVDTVGDDTILRAVRLLTPIVEDVPMGMAFLLDVPEPTDEEIEQVVRPVAVYRRTFAVLR